MASSPEPAIPSPNTPIHLGTESRPMAVDGTPCDLQATDLNDDTIGPASSPSAVLAQAPQEALESTKAITKTCTESPNLPHQPHEPPTHQSKVTGFLSLPGELRNTIYRMCVVMDRPINVHYIMNPGATNYYLGIPYPGPKLRGLKVRVLFLNKTIYHEARTLLYSENKWDFPCECSSDTVDRFFATIGPENAALLQTVRLWLPFSPFVETIELACPKLTWISLVVEDYWLVKEHEASLAQEAPLDVEEQEASLAQEAPLDVEEQEASLDGEEQEASFDFIKKINDRIREKNPDITRIGVTIVPDRWKLLVVPDRWERLVHGGKCVKIKKKMESFGWRVQIIS